MSDPVSAFNSLPRHARTFEDVPNDWIFTVRHVPVYPEADLIMLVNPTSRESRCEGPVELSKLMPRDYYGVIAQCLLSAFVSGLGTGEDRKKVAPWTWKTTEEKMAREVSGVLKALGVREELVDVGVADEEVKKVAEAQWRDVLGTLQRSVA
ncbi:hypothetical protein LshimejAT787_0411730 [Lyophyllum shimeji]|uniref:Uncharacterized protein n=1 Tax=Lyophyllum shimeji TaxID=47721 RepID=A0A9P3PKT1_LYOSH|nr:hypothetical protein LshimejAT787_0411730 [Lyophyllum shimeji]